MRILFRTRAEADFVYFARVIVDALDRDLWRARDIACSLDPDHVVKLGLEEALSITQLLTYRLTHGFNPDEAMSLTLELAHSVTRTHRHVLDAGYAHGTARHFVAVLNDACKGIAMLSQQLSASAEQQGKAARLRISPLAGRMTCIAARLLPCCDRLRYSEEYRAELYELALCSRRAQWGYAVRLLACAVPLRRELRRDAREVVQGR